MFRLIHRNQRQAILPLLALLLFQCSGWLVAWHVAWQDARWTMQQRMFEPEAARLQITLSSVEFQNMQLDDQREIRYEGKLYDIRYQVNKADSVYLDLCHDAQEERLVDALGGLLLPDASDHAPASPLRAWWGKWFGASFLAPADAPRLAILASLDHTDVFSCELPAGQDAPERHFPPPELSSV